MWNPSQTTSTDLRRMVFGPPISERRVTRLLGGSTSEPPRAEDGCRGLCTGPGRHAARFPLLQSTTSPDRPPHSLLRPDRLLHRRGSDTPGQACRHSQPRRARQTLVRHTLRNATPRSPYGSSYSCSTCWARASTLEGLQGTGEPLRRAPLTGQILSTGNFCSTGSSHSAHTFVGRPALLNLQTGGRDRVRRWEKEQFCEAVLGR